MTSRVAGYFAGKRVWVTGASSGIGQALVEELSSAGATVLASARREDRLRDLVASNDGASALALDISRFELIEEQVIRAWDMLGGIDVLFNNAGVSQRFLFAEADPAVLRHVVDVNLTGTMLLTRAVVGRMLAAGGGHIVTVTSFAARLPTPLRSVYTAAKMGLHGLFDCIRSEVEPQGIMVTLVVPGLVRTDISSNAVLADGSAYGVMDRNQANGMDPKECAGRILNAVARRRREFAVGLAPILRFGSFMRRFMPALFFKMVGKVRVSGK